MIDKQMGKIEKDDLDKKVRKMEASEAEKILKKDPRYKSLFDDRT